MDINDEASIDGDDQSDSNNSIHGGDQHEEEWKGISGEQVGAEAATYEHRTGTKPKKPSTGHELRAIKDATDLFNQALSNPRCECS